MKNLIDKIQQLSKKHRNDWQLTDNYIDVSIIADGRIQRVSFSLKGEEYILTSVVLGTKSVTASSKRWRELAKIAWQKNAHHELVTL